MKECRLIEFEREKSKRTHIIHESTVNEIGENIVLFDKNAEHPAGRIKIIKR